MRFDAVIGRLKGDSVQCATLRMHRRGAQLRRACIKIARVLVVDIMRNA